MSAQARPYWFVAADTSSSRFAQVTGLTEGRGFTTRTVPGRPCGVYPRSFALSLCQRLADAGITHHALVGVASHAEGARRLAHLNDHSKETPDA